MRVNAKGACAALTRDEKWSPGEKSRAKIFVAVIDVGGLRYRVIFLKIHDRKFV